jgi:hypothetical protein
MLNNKSIPTNNYKLKKKTSAFGWMSWQPKKK